MEGEREGEGRREGKLEDISKKTSELVSKKTSELVTTIEGEKKGEVEGRREKKPVSIEGREEKLVEISKKISELTSTMEGVGAREIKASLAERLRAIIDVDSGKTLLDMIKDVAVGPGVKEGVKMLNPIISSVDGMGSSKDSMGVVRSEVNRGVVSVKLGNIDVKKEKDDVST